MLRNHYLLKSLIDSAEQFRDGNLDIETLQNNISAIMSALEGDIPKVLRDAIRRAEAEIDSIRFTIESEIQMNEIIKVLNELENLIDTLDK